MAYKVRAVRTSEADALAPKDALRTLREGNQRFMRGQLLGARTNHQLRKQLAEQGQAPHAAVIGCADSRAPLEAIFDAMPGDLFVLRNAGNTCTHAEGSMVGSLEFATGALKSRLILVLGHTECGAIKGATAAHFATPVGATTSALQGLLQDLGAVAQQAAEEMGPSCDEELVANHAVKVNVYHTMDFLLRHSEAIREKVRSGEVEIQGAVYHLNSGLVDFMGQSPKQFDILYTEPERSLPPSMRPALEGGAQGVRTAEDEVVPALAALKMLKEGNERFAVGASGLSTTVEQRAPLATSGQAPHSAILGCADSRVPIDTVFDAMPGDIFNLRNAGNTCSHAEGSMVGSLEFCVSALKTQLILVLGHTECGAIKGATKTFLEPPETTAPGSALEGLLMDLTKVAERANKELGPGVDAETLAKHAVKVNVFHSMEFLLQHSTLLRSKVEKGELEIQGGIYNLQTGRVDFLGRCPLQSQLMCSSSSLPPSMTQRPVRTTGSEVVKPSEAMRLLREGNERYSEGSAVVGQTTAAMRTALVKEGQAPHTAIIGCADSRAPLETIFDAMPGDLFVLRNAGNTCTHAEGSMVGSLEFATGALKSRLILVLGHTQCGAIKGATAAYFAAQKSAPGASSSALQGLLHDLSTVAQEAAAEMGPRADEVMVANHAVKVNVFHTMEFLLKYSQSLREKVKTGELEIQGAVYSLETGQVDFLGQPRRQKELLSSTLGVPPSMAPVEAEQGVRTKADPVVPGLEALQMLKEGNERFAVGAPRASQVSEEMRRALEKEGQQPHSAILGCADSRVPIGTVFDAMPGDLFVLRNAGNTCTHAEGSMVGSLEFCVSALKTRCILVMGHTECGAIKGACQSFLSNQQEAPGSALEGLLLDLKQVAVRASREMGAGSFSTKDLTNFAVKVNVFHSIEFLLKYSKTLRSMVATGELEVQGAVYHLATGRVEFLGRSPKQAELIASSSELPPSMDTLAIRTAGSGVVRPSEAMKLLQEGNRRYVQGTAVGHQISLEMRTRLVKEGQQPHTAIIGCADSRAPLETIFDAMPGDLFVLRNAGNTCTHAEGSVLGSLEFCTAALNTKMILVLGHTECGAIKGATKTYFAARKAGKAPTVSKALDALLDGLRTVAEKAHRELGEVGEERVAAHAVTKNVFHSIDFLLQYSAVVREKVASGEVDVQGGVYDLETGEVKFLGRSPNHQRLLQSGAALPPSIVQK